MAQDWTEFLNNTAQDFIGTRAADLQRSSSEPVAVSPSGVKYVEGQPAKTTAGMPQTIMGIKPLYLGLGVAAILGVAYLVMRK
ncbi:MAG TPA: hypothetical protein VIU93_02635 [Gallionellaceae bacterium]